MIDRLFTAALTFVLLAGGTAAVGSALFGQEAPAAPAPAVAQVQQLPRVEIVVERQRVAAQVASGEASTPRVQ